MSILHFSWGNQMQSFTCASKVFFFAFLGTKSKLLGTLIKEKHDPLYPIWCPHTPPFLYAEHEMTAEFKC